MRIFAPMRPVSMPSPYPCLFHRPCPCLCRGYWKTQGTCLFHGSWRDGSPAFLDLFCDFCLCLSTQCQAALKNLSPVLQRSFVHRSVLLRVLLPRWPRRGRGPANGGQVNRRAPPRHLTWLTESHTPCSVPTGTGTGLICHGRHGRECGSAGPPPIRRCRRTWLACTACRQRLIPILPALLHICTRRFTGAGVLEKKKCTHLVRSRPPIIISRDETPRTRVLPVAPALSLPPPPPATAVNLAFCMSKDICLVTPVALNSRCPAAALLFPQSQLRKKTQVGLGVRASCAHLR